MLCDLVKIFVLLFVTSWVTSEEQPWNGSCPRSCLCSVRPSAHLYRPLKTVNCANQGLSSIPRDIAWDTEILILRDNQISAIGESLGSLTQLKELDISQNKLTYIGPDIFHPLRSLEYIDLNHNEIDTVTRGTFSDLSNLEDLLLSFNGISEIEERAFEGLFSLQRLTLSNNLLDWLNPEWLHSMGQLYTLLLDHNRIFRIGDYVFWNLKQLNKLSLSGNEIKTIEPKAFVGLENLGFLYLDENRMRHVPAHALKIFNKMNTITMDRNPIVSISAFDFYNLSASQLNLNEMPLLSTVHKNAFVNLQKLEILQIHNNPNLVFFDREAFNNTPNLSELFLHGNQLRVLEVGVFSSLPALSVVSFYGNPVRCDCNALWVRTLLQNRTSSGIRFTEPERIVCHSPEHYRYRTLLELKPATDIPPVCPPHILSLFNRSNRLHVGDDIRLQCHSLGFPEPKLHWLLPDGSIVNNSYNPVEGISVESDDTLVLKSVKQTQSGTYTCVAVNTEGSDTMSADMAVQSINVHIFPTGVSATFVTIMWNGTDIITVPEYEILYRLAEGDTRNDSAVPKFRKVQVSTPMRRYTLESLIPSTNYEICIAFEHNGVDIQIACTTVKTQDVAFLVQGIRRTSNVAVGITLGIVVGMICFICLTSCAAKRYRQRKYDDPESNYIDTMSHIPLENLYSPLMSSINT